MRHMIDIYDAEEHTYTTKAFTEVSHDGITDMQCRQLFTFGEIKNEVDNDDDDIHWDLVYYDRDVLEEKVWDCLTNYLDKLPPSYSHDTRKDICDMHIYPCYDNNAVLCTFKFYDCKSRTIRIASSLKELKYEIQEFTGVPFRYVNNIINYCLLSDEERENFND